MKTIFTFFAPSMAALLIVASPTHAGHVYGGLIDSNVNGSLGAGDALSFVSNTTGAVVTGQSQGVQTMTQVTVGTQAGLYNTSNISFTALSNGLNWTGSAYRAANPYAATTGSLLQLQIVSITGPTGAKFSFWDDAISLTNPAITYTVGTSGATAYWNLTDTSLTVGNGVTPNPTGVNNPPTDPYGHIHGRSFTVDTPGEYTVSYVLHDANAQHADSAPFAVSYSAVPEPGATAVIVASAIAALAFLRRRSAKANR